MSKLYLVDASSYIFRAYYAIKQELGSPDGTPVNAVYGFKNMIMQLLRQEKPAYLGFIFDPSGPTFRNTIYPEYKANRSSPPPDLIPQFDLIREFSGMFGVPVIIPANYEADDALGALAEQFSEQLEVVLVSGDKDLTQLINDRVSMLDTMRNVLYNAEKVQEKFGVLPERIAEYLALTGDSSDNIPGARGVGPKTATKLLQQYGSLGQIGAHQHEIGGKLGEKIRNSWELVELSLRLTQIQTDLSELRLDYRLEDFANPTPDLESLQPFYEKLGFSEDYFIKQAKAEAAKTGGDAPQNTTGGTTTTIDTSAYRAITQAEELQRVVEQIAKLKLFSFDLETTSLIAPIAQIVGIALAYGEDRAVYVPTGHSTAQPQMALETALSLLAPLFADESQHMVVQNIKYDRSVLKNYGIELCAVPEDTMIQSYLLDASSREHSLNALAKKHCGHTMISYESITGKGKEQIGFAEVDIATATSYAAEDADLALRVHRILRPQITACGLEKLYTQVEMPLTAILAEMECHGVRIDSGVFSALSSKLHEEIGVLAEKIYEIAGEQFNIDSPKQLGAILFEKMGVQEGKKKTKTGYATDAATLEKIAKQEKAASNEAEQNQSIAQLLLDYRGKKKLVSTYLDTLPTKILPKTERIHTSYNQSVTATGRLSSQDPNLQNIPIKGKDGDRIRSAFVAPPGKVLIAADYSQIELRILACLSGDPNMIAAFTSGADIHAQTAAALLGLEPGDITPDDRRIAKAINFGIIYGMGAFRLSQEIGTSNREAKNFIETYFEKYSKIKDYIEETLVMTRECGYAKTLFDRRRKIPGINHLDHQTRTAAERMAINSRIQGSAADVIKMSMIAVNARLQQEGVPATLIMQVHDELVFEAESSQVAASVSLITEVMENVVDLGLPLLVNVGVGQNWKEAHA